jgi:hypothetical protein
VSTDTLQLETLPDVAVRQAVEVLKVPRNNV